MEGRFFCDMSYRAGHLHDNDYSPNVFPCSRELPMLFGGPLTLHVVAPLDLCSSVRPPSYF